jgi:phage terminase large subunit GpA-like protein
MATHRESSELAHSKEEGIRTDVTTNLETRVTALEEKIEEIKDDTLLARAEALNARAVANGAHFLAAQADRDVADFKNRLDKFQRSMNALRETQSEHTVAIRTLDGRVTGLESKVDKGFAKLAAGQDVITKMLTRIIKDD